MRVLLYALFVYHGANGLIMLADPGLWYANVPDVEHTGPLNVHFVRDIGFGFIAAALALFLAARREAGDAVIWPAAAFLGGHAGLHLAEMALHGIAPLAAVRDFLIIVVPGLAPLAIALAPRNVTKEART